MITMGYNINDIVTFMTSPVATFIDTLTEENIWNNWKMSPERAIQFLTDGIKNEDETYKEALVNRYGTFKLNQIEALIKDLKLDEDIESTKADAKEFLNILEGANEFSNFGRLLGVNQGIKTSEVEIQKFLNFMKSIFTDRLNKESSKLSEEDKKLFEDFGELDIPKWFQDEEYRKEVSSLYNKIKKCINIFEIFCHIKQFDAIRQLYDVVLETDKTASVKNSIFNAIITPEIAQNPYISEKYQKNLLSSIDNVFINKFIQEQNIQIPIPTNAPLLNSNREEYIAQGHSLNLKTPANIASFKVLMENYFFPSFKQGKVLVLDEYGKVKTKVFKQVASNKFIQSLHLGVDNSVTLIESDIDMNLIDNSPAAQRKYQLYSYALQELSNVYVSPTLTIADMFQLYNLISNKNKYGSRRLTTLFDKIVQSDNNALINQYYNWVGSIDFDGSFRFSSESDSEDTNNTLIINQKDLLIQAAPFVKSVVGQNDPYVWTVRDGVLTLMQKKGKGYSIVKDYMPKMAGESDEAYQQRIINQQNYFVLGGILSDLLEYKIDSITKLQDSERVLSYLKEFVKQGLLTIEKNCE